MAKHRLTDRTLKTLKPKRQRYEVMDTDVPGFGVRVSETDQRSFILIARYPGSPNPTRRAIGEYPAISLETARRRARDWRDLIEKGVDPKVHEARLKREEIRKQQTTFGAVAEDFLERHVSGQRRARDTAREIRKELIGPWGERPIAGITREDVVILVEAIAHRPAPYLAHVVLGHSRSLFNWAINRGTYGLETSPCDRVKPGALIGAKQPRQRILSDAEIATLWRASDAIGYPYGPLYRMLLLTGARKSEVSGARWSEFDLKKKIWTVPPERFKSNATHLVPLSDQAIAVLESLPRFTKGDHLFSHTFGEKPVRDFGKAKARLDKRMDGAPPWVIHDIRRTVRTRLASLRVPDMVAEMVIGHGRKGLQRVYDQHTYEAEMLEALELWAARLRDIVTPPPENLVSLRKGAGMSVEKHDKKVALDSAITAQDYARLLSGSGDLAKRLTEAFSHSDISERKRYILMLRGFAEFMRDLDCPHEWRSKTFELALALAELDEGITPKILQPATRQDGGRPSDEWRIWIVRSRAVLALDARLRAKVALGDAVKELKKRFPSLDGEPFTKKGWLKTSIRNWRRKMGDIKPGDHLDLVAEQHEDARAKLAAMTPAEAVAVADQLLADVLH